MLTGVASCCAGQVYPDEAEALFPPLTYVRSIKAQHEDLGQGVMAMVATVEPVFA